MNYLGYIRSACAGCPICTLMSRNKVGLDLHHKLKKNMINMTHVIWKRQLQVMKPGSIIFNLILRLKIRFGFHLRATDLSLRAGAKYQIACCMQYSLIRKVQSFKPQSPKVVLSLESFTKKVFLLNLLISIRNADCAPVSAASNYSIIMPRPINPLWY